MSASRITQGMTRRDALRTMLLGGAVLAVVGKCGVRARAADAQARARSVIQIWMWGGPSHLDTFDPKPEAGYDYCGPLDKPIDTNVPGVRICQLLPLLAQQADKYSIIRSMTHGNNGHESAAYIVQTGREPGGTLVYPSLGAIVSLFKGYDHGYDALIPPYVVLTTLIGRFSEVGFLGPRYKPFVTGGDPNQQRFAVEGIVAEGMTDKRQQGRRELLHALDMLGQAMPGNPAFQQFDRCEEKAYDMILGDGGKVFDLSQESPDVRNRYGRSTFGQSCLVARRLVEQGIPYVAINYPGWDTHKRHFETMARKLPEMDRGMATLLQDLSDRGLLETTIVWWSGEFGRTPRVDWGEPWNGGRGHYGQCFSAVLAGGGFKGGHVIGASDAKGERPTDQPVHPREVIRAICELMGIDPDGPLPNPRGLDIQVAPREGDSTKGGGPLAEIMQSGPQGAN